MNLHNKFNNDLAFFAAQAPLMIKPKSGPLTNLKFNRAQFLVHQRLERQLKETGKVRALVLKGRQQGISTYVNARFYHKTRTGNTNTFILSHEASTTDKLFKMVKRYHDGVAPQLRPSTSASNRKELVFDNIDSEYYIGTAGNADVGRGGTVQLFHGSEAHFWSNTDDIESGVMESVPDEDGTEIILESTANGMDGMFYEKCMTAMDGLSDYILIFVPWFIQEEYRRKVPEDFILTEYEEEIKRLYDLDNEQLAWRRKKIENAKSGLKQFMQEYPCNVMEAFQTSGDGLITPDSIMKARKNKRTDSHAPLILGVDPARGGPKRDLTAIAFRRGREVPSLLTWETMDEMRLAGIVARFINKYSPAKVFIDVGYGNGTIDRLKELGFQNIVEGVNFGSGADQDEIYANKRAEMWIEMRDWLQEGGVNIPDCDKLHADLSVMPDFLTKSNGQMQLVGKDKIRKDFKRSPDRGDAVALTFAAPVLRIDPNARSQKVKNSGGGLKTQRKRGNG